MQGTKINRDTILENLRAEIAAAARSSGAARASG